MTTSPATALEPASWGRRFGALILDWAACSLVTLAVLGSSGYSQNRASGWVTLGVFFLETGVGTALLGASFGQLLTRIRVLRTDGRPLGLLPALARALAVCLVVPPLVFKPDGRGLHDLWTSSGAYVLPRPVAG